VPYLVAGDFVFSSIALVFLCSFELVNLKLRLAILNPFVKVLHVLGQVEDSAAS
jgi:hypothetical protein